MEQEENDSIEMVQEKSTNIDDMQCGLKCITIVLKLTLRVPFSFNTHRSNENLNQRQRLNFSIKSTTFKTYLRALLHKQLSSSQCKEGIH